MIFALFRTKVQTLTPFREIDPEFSQRVQCAPAEPFTIVLFFVFAGNVGSLQTQIPQKIQTPNIWPTTNKYIKALNS